jgi:hypothetical protein
MPAADLDLDTSVAALEAMGFEIPCGHSCHDREGWKHQHQGPATHWILALHNCTGGDSLYPGCTPWAAHVDSMLRSPWTCPRCKNTDDGRFMVITLGRITA